jgi:hypothetical protein
MVRPVFTVRLLRLAAALLIAAAWAAHIGETAHGDGAHCQVCAVSCSPELNADCGSDLLAPPQGPVFDAPQFSASRPQFPVVPVFRGRAPPLV